MPPRIDPPKWKTNLRRIFKLKKKELISAVPASSDGGDSAPAPPNPKPEQPADKGANPPEVPNLAIDELPQDPDSRQSDALEDECEPRPLADDSLPPITTLWDEAYTGLAKAPATSKLIADYELIGFKSTGLDKAPEKVEERKKHLEKLIKGKTDEIEKDTWKLEFVGFEFKVRDLVKPVVSIIQWGKDYVGDAVQASPPASVAWAGVCLLLPVSRALQELGLPIHHHH
jgi:hypothetical protein